MVSGSSPRARGTPGLSQCHISLLRFIPASAGNTPRSGRHGRPTPVHPRERGEHEPGPRGGWADRGSSPRARGTHAITLLHGCRCRFIPASAGNTRSASWFGWQAPVHPRERGEHLGIAYRLKEDFGSSPRARGTHGHAGVPVGCPRFIPASAGNTTDTPTIIRPQPVHPRERGEHDYREDADNSVGGSSPRARGTRPGTRNKQAARRFIPASAGNTRSFQRKPAQPSVHPRERGEHGPARHRWRRGCGSSPRARGTRW